MGGPLGVASGECVGGTCQWEESVESGRNFGFQKELEQLLRVGGISPKAFVEWTGVWDGLVTWVGGACMGRSVGEFVECVGWYVKAWGGLVQSMRGAWPTVCSRVRRLLGPPGGHLEAVCIPDVSQDEFGVADGGCVTDQLGDHPQRPRGLHLEPPALQGPRVGSGRELKDSQTHRQTDELLGPYSESELVDLAPGAVIQEGWFSLHILE